MLRHILNSLKGSIFHPQWLSDRFHIKSKQSLKNIRDSYILDIGSGNASYLDLVHSSNTLFTIDYPDTNKRYTGNPEIYSDARCLPIENNKIDVVLLFEVLEHIIETQSVIAEIRRVLRPDGKFFISVPFLYPIHDAPGDFWRFTEYGITEVLKKNGFEITDTTTHGNTLVSALQMLNMGFLEIFRDCYRRNQFLGFVSGLLVYPVTLGINFLAWPLIHLPLGKAGNFGYFLIAKLKDV